MFESVTGSSLRDSQQPTSCGSDWVGLGFQDWELGYVVQFTKTDFSKVRTKRIK